MKRLSLKFWVILIAMIILVATGYYFTTYKTLKLGRWNLTGKIDADIWSGLNQDLKNVTSSLNGVFEQAGLPRRVKAGARNNPVAQNNSTSTENVLIEKIKTKINQ